MQLFLLEQQEKVQHYHNEHKECIEVAVAVCKKEVV